MVTFRVLSSCSYCLWCLRQQHGFSLLKDSGIEAIRLQVLGKASAKGTPSSWPGVQKLCGFGVYRASA